MFSTDCARGTTALSEQRKNFEKDFIPFSRMMSSTIYNIACNSEMFLLSNNNILIRYLSNPDTRQCLRRNHSLKHWLRSISSASCVAHSIEVYDSLNF